MPQPTEEELNDLRNQVSTLKASLAEQSQSIDQRLTVQDFTKYKTDQAAEKSKEEKDKSAWGNFFKSADFEKFYSDWEKAIASGESTAFKNEADLNMNQINGLGTSWNLLKFEPTALVNLTDLIGDPGAWIRKSFYSYVLGRDTPEEIEKRRNELRINEIGNEAFLAKTRAQHANTRAERALTKAETAQQHSETTRRLAARASATARSAGRAADVAGYDAQSALITLNNLRTAAAHANDDVVVLRDRLNDLVNVLRM